MTPCHDKLLGMTSAAASPAPPAGPATVDAEAASAAPPPQGHHIIRNDKHHTNPPHLMDVVGLIPLLSDSHPKSGSLTAFHVLHENWSGGVLETVVGVHAACKSSAYLDE